MVRGGIEKLESGKSQTGKHYLTVGAMASSSCVVSKGLVPMSDFNVQDYTGDNSDPTLPELRTSNGISHKDTKLSLHTRLVELRHERGPQANQTL